MREYEYIAFDRERYDSIGEMFEDIGYTIQTLIKNDYIVVFKYEDCGIYILEYEHNENKEPFGCVNPYWITEEEYEVVLNYRDEQP